MSQDSSEESIKNIKRAITLIYIGGILFADVMFISYVSHAFEGGIVALFATFGAILVGLSGVVFLFAKDHWFADGWHEKLGYAFWAVDLFMLALNTLVAFNAAGVINPDDVPIFNDVLKFWSVLSPATPLIVIGMWAILRAVSPDMALVKAGNKQRANLIKKQSEYLIDQALNSEEAKDILKKAAEEITIQNAKTIAGAGYGKLPENVSTPASSVPLFGKPPKA